MERPGGVADKGTPTLLSDWFTGGTKGTHNLVMIITYSLSWFKKRIR